MTQATLNAGVLHYELQVSINASRASVWSALTEATNAWWLPDFHMVGQDSVVTFDAQAGGHLIERHPGGGSLLWYTVQLCQPGESLNLVGHVAPGWGGPATTLLELKLEDEGEGCVLRVSDALYGHVSEKAAQSLKEGWAKLFGEGLKAHVEA